jgi:hypothetical protein
MQRVCLCLGLWLGLFLNYATAVPARLSYEPEPNPKPAPVPVRVVIDLNGTAWLGKYGVADRIYIFEPDGTVSYRTLAAKATIFRNRGTWKLEGNQFSFEHTIGKNKVLEFRGTITDQNAIDGEMIMVRTNQRSNIILKRTTLP